MNVFIFPICIDEFNNLIVTHKRLRQYTIVISFVRVAMLCTTKLTVKVLIASE